MSKKNKKNNKTNTKNNSNNIKNNNETVKDISKKTELKAETKAEPKAKAEALKAQAEQKEKSSAKNEHTLLNDNVHNAEVNNETIGEIELNESFDMVVLLQEEDKQIEEIDVVNPHVIDKDVAEDIRRNIDDFYVEKVDYIDEDDNNNNDSKSLSAAAMLLGIFGSICASFPVTIFQIVAVAMSVVGLILGLIARKRTINKFGAPLGLANAGVVLGIIGTVISVACLICMGTCGNNVCARIVYKYIK